MPFEEKDGSFSALMMILSDESMQEFEKPSDQGVRVSALKSVRPGEAANVVVAFMGPAVDANGETDVTFDLRVTNPDGTLGPDAKDIIALKHKIDTPWRVFHSQSEVKFVFDESEMPGVYKLSGTIYDNIAHRRVPIEASVELMH